MSRPIVINHDVATGEVTEREMNDEEYADWQERAAKAKLEKDQELANIAAKESAQAKLEALGLTADDLKALGLGNN
jgi:hypothetical protein